jgi:hypothetical protein
MAVLVVLAAMVDQVLEAQEVVALQEMAVRRQLEMAVTLVLLDQQTVVLAEALVTEAPEEQVAMLTHLQ